MKVKRIDRTKTLVSPTVCAKCVFRGGGEGEGHYCRYSEIMGHTRTSLHPEGLTSDCKEFVKKQKKHQYQADIK